MRVLVPEYLDTEIIRLVRPVMNRSIEDASDLLVRIKQIENLAHEVMIYPDVEKYMNRILYLGRIGKKVDEICKDPKNHPLRKTLLNTELLPYQLDGIAFAVGIGRAVPNCLVGSYSL